MAIYFSDREQAAQQLAVLLAKHKGPQTLVLAIPRGGVPIGSVLAHQLGAPLDLLMAKKIGYPGNPEFAVAAVCENESVLQAPQEVSREYIDHQREKIKQELQERYRTLTRREQPVSTTKRNVIITDDGIATGCTMLAAVRAIRKQRPAAVIVATPVCSHEARIRLKPEVDELISCYYPDPFVGVGRFYRQFEQVTDQEVREMLLTTIPSIKPASSP